MNSFQHAGNITGMRNGKGAGKTLSFLFQILCGEESGMGKGEPVLFSYPETGWGLRNHPERRAGDKGRTDGRKGDGIKRGIPVLSGVFSDKTARDKASSGTGDAASCIL